MKLNGQALKAQPSGGCSFITPLRSRGGAHRLSAHVRTDTHAESLQTEINLIKSAKPLVNASSRPQWGTFWIVLLFVVGTLLGGLLALKRKP